MFEKRIQRKKEKKKKVYRREEILTPNSKTDQKQKKVVFTAKEKTEVKGTTNINQILLFVCTTTEVQN